MGADTQSFSTALKYALRQDPDVILVGEMRDLETISAALTIAETGHLVFATLHTNSAAESINRIIDAFPSHQQAQVRAQLAFVLEGVITQTLIPRAKGKGRIAAVEVMMCTAAIRAVIRDEKIHQIYSLMQAGKKHGMQTMNDALQMLYIQGEITLERGAQAFGRPERASARGRGDRAGITRSTHHRDAPCPYSATAPGLLPAATFRPERSSSPARTTSSPIYTGRS